MKPVGNFEQKFPVQTYIKIPPNFLLSSYVRQVLSLRMEQGTSSFKWYLLIYCVISRGTRDKECVSRFEFGRVASKVLNVKKSAWYEILRVAYNLFNWHVINAGNSYQPKRKAEFLLHSQKFFSLFPEMVIQRNRKYLICTEYENVVTESKVDKPCWIYCLRINYETKITCNNNNNSFVKPSALAT